MRAYEWVTVVYFSYVAVLGWTRHLRPGQRIRITGAVLGVVVMLVGARVWPGPPGFAIRDWLPLAYVLLGYWASGGLFVTPMTSLESRLASIDRRVFAAVALPPWLGRPRRAFLELFEALYFCTPAFLPAGFAIVLAAGRVDLVDRYWTAVVLAEFGAFAVLPWVQTRAPRDVDPDALEVPGDVAWRTVNRRITLPLAIGVNTCPSGHASGSLAVALSVGVAVPAAGVALVIMALGVGLASIVGRYHYVVDVVTGVVLAAVSFAVAAPLAG